MRLGRPAEQIDREEVAAQLARLARLSLERRVARQAEDRWRVAKLGIARPLLRRQGFRHSLELVIGAVSWGGSESRQQLRAGKDPFVHETLEQRLAQAVVPLVGDVAPVEDLTTQEAQRCPRNGVVAVGRAQQPPSGRHARLQIKLVERVSLFPVPSVGGKLAPLAHHRVEDAQCEDDRLQLRRRRPFCRHRIALSLIAHSLERAQHVVLESVRRLVRQLNRRLQHADGHAFGWF
mmetsp:Transcript_6276/g.13911  ORF Transcript_6276/g.13911 Transcript_6276/m.13911 type:complete len:235 (+) Transcript_6276:888-1592(+)